MRRSLSPAIFAFMCIVLSDGCDHPSQSQSRQSDGPLTARGRSEREVARTLDSLHEAASKAQFDCYFLLFAHDAVFLGTDASERWTLDQFKAYTKPIFANGRGWTYRPVERHIDISGNHAWFDELLKNEKYGTCRGSGVLRWTPDEDGGGLWRVVQYNLSVPIPNDLLEGVAKDIRAYETAHPKPGQK